MSSTQLLHSLSLLLLPLRCRRNCNQLISLAILLLSALSARIEESGQQEQQSEEAEQEATAAAAEAEEEKDKEVDEDDNDTPYIATKVALKRRSLIINPIPNPHPQSHPYPHPNLHQNPHQIPTSGRTFAKGTGTGAALTSWHSSHSHRSPGAKSSEEAEEQHQARLLASRIIVLHLACASLLLHTLGTSSISSPSIARLAERTTTAAPTAAEGAATTKRLAAAALTQRSKILESGVSSSSSSSSTNPSTPVAGRAVSRRVTAPAAAAAGVSIAT
ncbi:Hypothetical predicted protein [Drosophila guanche]|uniref:Uncharacterized protein n=1 Tax=Drosophila guanche TaxID=7266 RepID=A0A3B0J503_DROGU|nr:Hypothetical predicted protein [Drosophila guanche]